MNRREAGAERLFVKNDSGFVCANCGRTVLPLGYSSRNHCPFCLWSVHLDDNPGDRRSACGGLMEPVSAIPDSRKGYIIVHKCQKCGAVRRCKAAHEAAVQPDDLELIIRLTVAE
ncbi:MAG: RNHCP domain-containing protein [Clostridia bacterium]|nr:RNHCP domain-containing protein [Clostridia bacterium]